jgi:hypothetical protein
MEITSMGDFRELEGFKLLKVQVQLVVQLEATVLVHFGSHLQTLNQLEEKNKVLAVRGHSNNT